MIRAALLLVAMLAPAMPAAAQVRPQAGTGDPHVQWIDYKPDQVVQLEVALGYQLVLEFASDDPVLNVALGNPSAFQAAAAKSGDRVYLQALVASGATNMTVVTANRRYLFELSALAQTSPSTPYAVRFRYGAPERAEQPEAALPLGRYRLSGARALQPSAISDDGIRTMIVWPPEAALPAVFALDDHGRETVVSGNMRDGIYVVDAINRRLVFRIDDQAARAERVVLRPGRGD